MFKKLIGSYKESKRERAQQKYEEATRRYEESQRRLAESQKRMAAIKGTDELLADLNKIGKDIEDTANKIKTASNNDPIKEAELLSMTDDDRMEYLQLMKSIVELQQRVESLNK